MSMDYLQMSQRVIKWMCHFHMSCYLSSPGNVVCGLFIPCALFVHSSLYSTPFPSLLPIRNVQQIDLLTPPDA